MINKLKILFLENFYFGHIVFKNAFWLYLGEFISKGLRLLVFLLIARFLGAQNFGIIEYFLSFIGLFFLFADFGISSIFIRDFQQKENKQELINLAFFLKIILAVIFSVLALLGYFFSKKFDSFLIYLLFVVFYFFRHLEGFFESYFLAVQKTQKRFIFNTLSSLSLLITVFLGLLIFKNIITIALSYLFSMIVSLVVAYFLFKQEANFSFKINYSLIKYYFFNGLPLVLFGILDYIFFSTDKIILSHLRPIEETGYYSVASRIISVILVIPSLFYTALFPYLSKQISIQNWILIKKIFNYSMLFSITAGLIFAILCFILAPFLIPLFFGNEFINSIAILQIFIWILVFIFPTNFLNILLISLNKQWLDFFVTLIPAILNIILNFIFIPNYGVFGAVYSSLLAQILNFILTFLASYVILKKLSYNKKEKN